MAVLVLLNLLLWPLTRWFDRALFIPFQKRAGIVPARHPEYNPHLLRLGLLTAGGGIVVYLSIGWIVW